MQCIHGISVTKDCYYCMNGVEPSEDTPKLYGGARAGGMTCIRELHQNNKELIEVWDNLVVGRGKTAEAILDELHPAMRKIKESL